MPRLQIDQYDRLSDRVYLHRPETSTEPETILLLGLFMDAPPKLITRYAADYRLHFPKYTVVLLLNDWKSMFTWASKPVTDLRPAIDYVVDHRRATIKGAIYSGGGVSVLTSIAKAYRSKTQSPLELESTLIDSAPATTNDFVAHHGAFLNLVPSSLRRFPLGLIFDLLLWIIFGTWILIAAVLGYRDPTSALRADLNDTSLLVPRNPRTYIYSRSDKVMGWKGVESSAKEAEERGWIVKREEFKGTKHVSHVVGDKERYWRIVEGTLK